MSFTGYYLLAQDGKHVELKEKQLLGRDSSCDVVIALGQPSRRHAEIAIRDGLVSIVDLGSTNGSFVNDRKLDANVPVTLKAGDRIRLDANSFTLERQPDANATVMRPVPPVDINATVMRPVPSIDATPVARPEAPKAKAPKPETPKPETPKPETPKPEAPKPEAQAKPTTPESWALQGRQAVAGTQLLSGTQMQSIRASLNAEALASQQVDVPTLTLVGGVQQGHKFTLGTGAAGNVNKWEIGRASSCDVVIDDPSVSSNHAQIINDGARWKLIDLMSANGTYVNGEKGLTTYLANGDRLRFGTVDAVFQLGGSAGTTSQRIPSAARSEKTTMSTTAIAAIAFAVTLVVIVVVFVFLK